jgi:hypothetical protein
MKLTNACIGAVALGVLAGCGSGGAAGPAREGARSPSEAAQSPSEGAARGPGQGPVSQEDADRCLLRGRAELEAKRYGEAERRLEIAWGVDGRAEIAADLGRVEVELGKLGEAAAHLSAALDGGVGAVEAQLAELRPKLGSVALKPPSAGVEVSVFVDGWRATHRLPRAELWLSPGKHDVELRVGLKIVAKKSLDIELGKRLDWDASIDGKVDLDAPLDGNLGGKLGGNLDADVNVKVPSASAGLSTPLIVVGSIVGSVAIAVGAGLAVAASNLSADAGKIDAKLKADANVKLPCQGANRAGHEAECALFEAKIKDQELFLEVGIPVLVTAGLIVGGGLAYILWPRAKAPDAKLEICGVTVRPGVGLSSLSLQGTF